VSGREPARGPGEGEPGGTEPIESPCNDVCVIDPETGLCEGCLRSLDEIAEWGLYSPAERRRIIDQLPGRSEG
jgi:predicted Fe-S protein YdhL (DUF1289 family)